MTIAHGCCTDTYSLHKLFYLNLFSYSYTYQTSHSNLNLSLYNYEFHPTDLLLAHLLSVEVSPTFSHIYISSLSIWISVTVLIQAIASNCFSCSQYSSLTAIVCSFLFRKKRTSPFNHKSYTIRKLLL